MAEIVVELEIDSGDWSRALDDMYARIVVATGDASMDAAGLIQRITQGLLTERSHGEFEWTDSAPGDPPAMVSGALAASIDTARSGPMSAIVGPTDLPYARIQELGGPMFGHPLMVFYKYGLSGELVKFKRTFVQLDERPYLKPATEEAVDTGEVRDIYVEHWAAAIEG